MGGVIRPEDYKAYREAGANAVMSATGAMWNARLAQDIKAALYSQVRLRLICALLRFTVLFSHSLEGLVQHGGSCPS